MCRYILVIQQILDNEAAFKRQDSIIFTNHFILESIPGLLGILVYAKNTFTCRDISIASPPTGFWEVRGGNLTTEGQPTRTEGEHRKLLIESTSRSGSNREPCSCEAATYYSAPQCRPCTRFMDDKFKPSNKLLAPQKKKKTHKRFHDKCSGSSRGWEWEKSNGTLLILWTMRDDVLCCLTEKNDSKRSTHFLYFEGEKTDGKSEVVNEMTLALFDCAGNSRALRSAGLLAVENADASDCASCSYCGLHLIRAVMR